MFTNSGYEDPPTPTPPLKSDLLYFSSYGRLYLQFTMTHLDFQVNLVKPKKKDLPKVTKFTGKMSNQLKRMENKFHNFCDVYFLRYARFGTEIQKKKRAS